MSCAIPEDFPLLPFEPVPRGETLAHWRNEMAALWTTSRLQWCAEVDLSAIEASIAALVAASGEANTATNVGTVGTGVFKQKSGLNLEFYKLNSADNKLAIALVGTDRIDFTINANNVVAASTDPRLSDARVPLAHASTHFSAGTDPIRIDELKIGTDVTTLNATTAEHGLMRKLSGVATEFYNGTGVFSTLTGITPGTANYLPKWTAAAPYLSATSLVYDNGTYVGVGVGASPLSALHVASSTAGGVTGSNVQLRLSDSINTAKCLLIGWDTVNAAGYIQATEVGISANLLQLNPSGGNVKVGSGFIIPLTGYLYGNGASIVSASASIPFSSITGTVGITQGGTGQITALLGFNALSPLTTRGDLLTRDATNNIRLAIGTVGKYLRTDGTDPGWSALLVADLSGQVTVANGGTGAATLTGILQGNGVSAVTGITGTTDVLPKWAASAPYLVDSLLHSGANLIEQYNSTNAQSWSLYGTRTDASNYERLTIKHNASATGITFTSEAAGAGMVVRNFRFNGGNIGIGVDPTKQLELSADIQLQNSKTIYARTAAGIARGCFGSDASDNLVYGGGAGWASLLFYPGANPALRIWNSGGVVLGSTFVGTDPGIDVVIAGKTVLINATTVAASMVGGIGIKNGTAPTGNVADCFQHYSADQVAGNAAPHWRTENGAILKLFQDAGWTLPTGTASKAGFDTATGTLTNALQTIKAIMDHLMTGTGLLGV